MKKSILVSILTVSFLLSPLSVFAVQHFPSAKSVGVIAGYWTKSNGSDAAPNNASDLNDSKVQTNLQWDAEHYDATVEMGRDWSYALPIYKTFNPDIFATYYDEMYQVVSDPSNGRYQAMVDWCAAHSVDIEDFFVHYSYDTDILKVSTPLTVKGWDPTHTNPLATAATPLEARVLDSNWEDQEGYVTWRLNVKNANYRAWAAEHLSENTAAGWDGEETDTMQYGSMLHDPDIHVSVSGASGMNSGNTIEYPISNWTGYPSSDARNAEYRADFMALMQYLRDNAATGKIGGNLSMYAKYWDFEQKSDHMRRESILDSVYMNTIQKGMATLGRFSVRGGKNFVQNLMLLYNYLPNTLETWNRDKLLGLAAFYIVQNPQYDYYNSQATNTYGCNDLTSGVFYNVFGAIPRNQAFFVNAISVDIGQPMQAIPNGFSAVRLLWDVDDGGPGWDIYSNQSTFSNGVPVYPTYSYIYTNGSSEVLDNGSGGTITANAPVYARSYTKGLVLARPRPSSSMAMNANNLGDAHALTITLPKSYRPVSADGTLGALTDTISLKILEGAILLDPDAVSADTTAPAAPQGLAVQ